mmetsp:Transcript_14492/g.37576  ORF Transcript_14492/g.37576 Transcript_14492/m.37576 type:complete len:117 (-) Transcript_14492:444-794(-)
MPRAAIAVTLTCVTSTTLAYTLPMVTRSSSVRMQTDGSSSSTLLSSVPWQLADKSPEIDLTFQDQTGFYLSDKPSEDPTQTCWLTNQYEYDKPLQYVCTSQSQLEDKQGDHSEDSY